MNITDNFVALQCCNRSLKTEVQNLYINTPYSIHNLLSGYVFSRMIWLPLRHRLRNTGWKVLYNRGPQILAFFIISISGNRNFVVLGTEVLNTNFQENMLKNEFLKWLWRFGR
jgi:hypothetical protein